MFNGMADTYKFKTNCLACSQVNDVATNILLEDKGPPDEGSLLMCSGCGHVMQFRSGKYESLTAEEVRRFSRDNSKPWQVMIALQRDIRLQDPPARRRKFLKG